LWHISSEEVNHFLDAVALTAQHIAPHPQPQPPALAPTLDVYKKLEGQQGAAPPRQSVEKVRYGVLCVQ
jgi:hypothetical protein